MSMISCAWILLVCACVVLCVAPCNPVQAIHTDAHQGANTLMEQLHEQQQQRLTSHAHDQIKHSIRARLQQRTYGTDPTNPFSPECDAAESFFTCAVDKSDTKKDMAKITETAKTKPQQVATELQQLLGKWKPQLQTYATKPATKDQDLVAWMSKFGDLLSVAIGEMTSVIELSVAAVSSKLGAESGLFVGIGAIESQDKKAPNAIDQTALEYIIIGNQQESDLIKQQIQLNQKTKFGVNVIVYKEFTRQSKTNFPGVAGNKLVGEQKKLLATLGACLQPTNSNGQTGNLIITTFHAWKKPEKQMKTGHRVGWVGWNGVKANAVEVGQVSAQNHVTGDYDIVTLAENYLCDCAGVEQFQGSRNQLVAQMAAVTWFPNRISDFFVNVPRFVLNQPARIESIAVDKPPTKSKLLFGNIKWYGFDQQNQVHQIPMYMIATAQNTIKGDSGGGMYMHNGATLTFQLTGILAGGYDYKLDNGNILKIDIWTPADRQQSLALVPNTHRVC